MKGMPVFSENIRRHFAALVKYGEATQAELARRYGASRQVIWLAVQRYQVEAKPEWTRPEMILSKSDREKLKAKGKRNGAR